MAGEKNFENKVKKFLEENGCYYIKHFSNAFTKSGIPDILASVNGYFVGIEVKASNGKPSPLQIYNLQKIDESGGYAVLLYPDDFETFKTFIKALIDFELFVENVHYKHYLCLKERWMEFANKL